VFLLLSIVAFLVLLSFLVFIHECGHFFAARKAGVTVEEFGFGLPPRAKTLFIRGGTRFSLNWIPFGGFVRLKGENAATERERTAKGSFGAASVPARIIILVGGVFMNFMFAMIILTLGFSLWHWIPTYTSLEELRDAAVRQEITMQPGVDIVGLRSGGPAEKAGVMAKSVLLAVDGDAVYIPSDVVSRQQGKASVSYTLRLEDGTQKIVDVPVHEGTTGVEIRFTPDVSAPNHSLPRAVLLSLREAKVMTTQTVGGLAGLAVSLLSQARVPEGITGPVGIAVLTHDSLQEGFMPYLRLVALLSLSLAILRGFFQVGG
jgi:regulator of sigma E protease